MGVGVVHGPRNLVVMLEGTWVRTSIFHWWVEKATNWELTSDMAAISLAFQTAQEWKPQLTYDLRPGRQ